MNLNINVLGLYISTDETFSILLIVSVCQEKGQKLEIMKVSTLKTYQLNEERFKNLFTCSHSSIEYYTKNTIWNNIL